MATTLEPARPTLTRPQHIGPRQSGIPSRLVSLDAYRGLIMLTLISHGFGFSSLSVYPSFAWLSRQVDHVAWEGIVFWDLIQPAFMFMVGVAMPLAFARRLAEGDSRRKVFGHVLWRALMLILLSNVLSNFNSSKPPVFQLINVLCQIAFAYVLCFAVMQLKMRMQVAAAAAVLAAHWALFTIFPGPEGAFSREGNIGQVIDKAVLGYNYSGYYVTINFLSSAITMLFGAWAGQFLMTAKPHAEKAKTIAMAAAACFAAGYALQPFNPMVKRIWTASFTFASAGWVLALLLAFYWTIEMRGYRRWAFPMIVLGMNSIFIYSFSQVLSGWLRRGIGVFTDSFKFLGPAGAIPHNLLALAAMWYLCYWLYQRKLFLKI